MLFQQIQLICKQTEYNYTLNLPYSKRNTEDRLSDKRGCRISIISACDRDMILSYDKELQIPRYYLGDYARVFKKMFFVRSFNLDDSIF